MVSGAWHVTMAELSSCESDVTRETENVLPTNGIRKQCVTVGVGVWDGCTPRPQPQVEHRRFLGH